MTELPNTPNWFYWISIIYPVISCLFIISLVWNDEIKTKKGKATVTFFAVSITLFAVAFALMFAEMKGLITL